MKNLKELQERYENIPDKSPGYGWTGYLAWGGRNFYEINSEKEVSLNRSYAGFILNGAGEVEHYDIHNQSIVGRTYYTDHDYFEESEEPTEFYHDETEIKKWWGKTLENYYPHPWFPNKEIIAFKVIRIMPELMIGDILSKAGSGYIGKSKNGFKKEYCLNWPEFFEPIYEE